MNEETHYLSKAKQKELTAELEDLKTNKRKEIAEHLEFAKSMGDLSENAEYHEARDEQARVEERITSLESILASAVIVSKRHSENIGVGSTVIVQKEGTRTKQTFSIVGSEEADTETGKISNNSPLGESLLDKKKGEAASFETPNGTITYKIISVE